MSKRIRPFAMGVNQDQYGNPCGMWMNHAADATRPDEPDEHCRLYSVEITVRNQKRTIYVLANSPQAAASQAHCVAENRDRHVGIVTGKVARLPVAIRGWSHNQF